MKKSGAENTGKRTTVQIETGKFDAPVEIDESMAAIEHINRLREVGELKLKGHFDKKKLTHTTLEDSKGSIHFFQDIEKRPRDAQESPDEKVH